MEVWGYYSTFYLRGMISLNLFFSTGSETNDRNAVALLLGSFCSGGGGVNCVMDESGWNKLAKLSSSLDVPFTRSQLFLHGRLSP